MSGTKWATQAGAEWLSDLVQADVNFANIDEGFTPGVGYVRRHDRMLGAKFSLKPRPGERLVRQFSITPNALVYQDRRGVPQTSVGGVLFAALFQSGDRMSGKVEFESERLPDPFEIAPNVGTARVTRLRGRGPSSCHAPPPPVVPTRP